MIAKAQTGQTLKSVADNSGQPQYVATVTNPNGGQPTQFQKDGQPFAGNYFEVVSEFETELTLNTEDKVEDDQGNLYFALDFGV